MAYTLASAEALADTLDRERGSASDLAELAERASAAEKVPTTDVRIIREAPPAFLLGMTWVIELSDEDHATEVRSWSGRQDALYADAERLGAFSD